MGTLVIGGGLIGLSTAYALQTRGESVTLIDARDAVAQETSFANGGLLTPSMPEPWNGPGVYRHLAASVFNPRASMRLRLHAIPSLIGWGLRFLKHSAPRHFFAACTDNYHLARYSLEQTATLTGTLGLEYDRGTDGTLSVFRAREDYATKRAICEHVRDLGMQYRVLTPGEIVELVPALASVQRQLYKGIHYPEDDFGDARRFCEALLPHFQAAGGQAEFGVRVHRLRRDGRRIAGVETSAGERIADKVVIAAGVQSPRLAADAGVDLPVKPAKGYSVTVEIPPSETLPALPVIDDSMHACLTPLGRRLRMVGTVEFTGFDTRIDRARTENLYRLFETLLPDIAARTDRATASPWAGLRPMSYDDRPFIGGTGVEGLYVNCGHGPLGWTMAAGSGQLLADQMIGQQCAIDATPFSLARAVSAVRKSIPARQRRSAGA
ncbi:MAG: FAD-dependent oxidoreductase [Pseudomonadota bacterium]